MNNKLLVFLFFLFLTGCATYQIRSVETEKNVWVKVSSANIRDGPSTKNKVIAGAKWNDKLVVINEKAKWYKVKLTAQSAGWIYKPLCSLEKLKGAKKVKPGSERGSYRKKKTWRDLSMAERKDIYLRVTDVPSGPEADRIISEMARKYNISEGDVLAILAKGTFEWGWGHLP